jgi:ankyrin repeat protein
VSSIDIFSLARHGRFQQLKQVLELGVDPNSKDKFGNTLLLIGAQNGNKAICKLALRFGAHINMTNINGNTALHYCSEYGYVELAEYFMSKGASTEILNLRGYKPLDGIKPARGKYETN